MASIALETLDNGLRIATQRIAGAGSLGMTWLLPLGASRDPADRSGVCSMLEEFVARGAGTRDARAHADALDRLGASTGSRTETFHLAISATMLGSRFADVFPLVGDMVLRPRLEAGDLEAVRDLCVQDVEGLADEPRERIMVELRKRHAPSPLNQPTIGDVSGLQAATLEDVRGRFSRGSVPNGSILAIAGDVDHAAAMSMVREATAGWSGQAEAVSWNDDSAERGYEHLDDATAQVHIAIAHDAPAESEDDAWCERVATAVLSGGMSGRLFTEVREKRSLCYAVYASYAGEAKYGRVVAYAGTTPDRAQETLDVLHGELQRITTPAGRVSEDELRRAKIGLASKLVMASESTSGLAGAMARDVHKLGRARPLEELTAAIEGVTLDRLNDFLARRALGRMTVVTIGPDGLNAPV